MKIGNIEPMDPTPEIQGQQANNEIEAIKAEVQRQTVNEIKQEIISK